MDIGQAMAHIKVGGRAARTAWDGEPAYVCYDVVSVTVMTDQGSTWEPSSADVLSLDWQYVPYPSPAQ